MLSFDDRFYTVSRGDKILLKTDAIKSHTHLQTLKGSHFAMAIKNSLYYENLTSPCSTVGCSHICVLSEATSGFKAKCVCPDKYQAESNGACAFDKKIEGAIVKTSSSRMTELCDKNTACRNGGRCKIAYEDSVNTPSCECRRGFDGLYCEQALVVKSSSKVAKLTLLLVLFLLCSVSLWSILFLRRNYPGFLPYLGSRLSPKSSPMRRMPGKNTSPSLLKNQDDNDSTIRINSFTNPLLGRTPTQRSTEEALESDLHSRTLIGSPLSKTSSTSSPDSTPEPF